MKSHCSLLQLHLLSITRQQRTDRYWKIRSTTHFQWRCMHVARAPSGTLISIENALHNISTVIGLLLTEQRINLSLLDRIARRQFQASCNLSRLHKLLATNRRTKNYRHRNLRISAYHSLGASTCCYDYSQKFMQRRNASECPTR